MKAKLYLLSLILIIASFSVADQKENVIGWLRQRVSKPSIHGEKKYIELTPELMEMDGTNGLDAIFMSLFPDNISTNMYNEIETKINEGTIADQNIKSIPPNNLIPLLFEILEEGALGTNEYADFYCNWYEDSETPCLGTYHGIKIRKGKNDIYGLACGYINKSQKVLTKSEDWYLTELWAKKYHPSTGSFPYFWWYEGRKYATNIWEDFECCWQYEQARTNPRPSVLRLLAREISELGISALPIVKDRIEHGDTTMGPVLKALAEKLEDGGITNSDFITWYYTEGSKYILPPCEGLEAAKARISDTNYVNELNGIITLGSPGHETVRLDDAKPAFMQIYLDQMLAYFTNRPPVPKHWYYKLPDDVLEVDKQYAYWLDRCSTNYNPRFLPPATE
ncbi:hypothetical protein J6U78_01045 [bacterium]|nr:hypothetical protein [bacterium]MBP5627112.1 hypothetical protein [bacterium]